MRQLNLNEIRRDPQLEQLLKPVGKGVSIETPLTSSPFEEEVPCSVCGYVNVPGLVICWVCGECLDPRIKQLAEARL